jgi:chromosome segregation protein
MARPPTGDGVIGSIVSYVDCEPRYRTVVDYLLKDVVIVEDLEKAFAISRRDTNGIHDFVTPEGDAVLGGSLVRAGQNGASSDALIGRRQKLAELAGKVEALKGLAAEQERSFDELRRSLESLRSEHEGRRLGLVEARKPLADLERVLESKRLERDSLAKGIQDLDSEIEAVRNGIEAAEAEIARLSQAHGLPPSGQGHLFDEKVETHDDLERDVAGLAKRLEETNVEMHKLDASVDFLDQTVARVKNESDALEQGLAALSAREGDLNEKKAEIGQAEAELVGEVARLLEALTGLEGERDAVAAKRRDLETAIEGARVRIRALQAEKEQQISAKQDMHSEGNLLAVKSDALKRRLLEEFEVDLETVDLASLEPVENPAEELAKLRGHVRDLGPVNLVALEEFDTEKQRFDFLRAQRDDLNKARESLDEAILQINKRARTEFAETFGKVRADFRKNFQTLFQGGDADLRLADENDPLESPVEILAQPTGKKLEHISLLSGGERALTALAFLFAVYYTKPSPFCLLDEVDAPLDDANVGRFINLLKDLSARTQFLMVTHNKKTMESAGCLYGVTMQEPGVSRIVSVRLERGAESAQLSAN